MQHPTSWWIAGAAAVGMVLGVSASVLTRRFLPHGRRQVAGSWWLGGVLTATVLAILAWRVGARGELAIYTVVVIVGVPLAVIDWCEHRLPRALVWPQLAGAVAGFVVLAIARGESASGLRALAALGAAGMFFLVLAVVSNGGLGAGDVGLAAVVGLVTGWSGWPQVLGALLVASLLAMVLIVVPGAHRGDDEDRLAVPFGPCLLGGALAMVAIGG
ncbi:prepilin peptidase [Amycolatopsis sp. CA-230715]|uniref:prepilin peptidase n=1 Tax=Amycolatopsis sp. CA-230715 TaxID=2745196 RepID=UPI001C332D06|nr:prepilin peptidase [Amycolatopsis sp. CA-230715]QWF81005.1 hypothetical protein HUW46_04430 [Amycolatopsis sp. CA-230715]